VETQAILEITLLPRALLNSLAQATETLLAGTLPLLVLLLADIYLPPVLQEGSTLHPVLPQADTAPNHLSHHPRNTSQVRTQANIITSSSTTRHPRYHRPTSIVIPASSSSSSSSSSHRRRRRRTGIPRLLDLLIKVTQHHLAPHPPRLPNSNFTVHKGRTGKASRSSSIRSVMGRRKRYVSGLIMQVRAQS
jgi:hypothetical protein